MIAVSWPWFPELLLCVPLVVLPAIEHAGRKRQQADPSWVAWDELLRRDRGRR